MKRRAPAVARTRSALLAHGWSISGHEWPGEETPGFDVVMSLHGKPVVNIRSQGTGGCALVAWNTTDTAMREALAKAVFTTLAARDSYVREHPEYFTSLHESALIFVPLALEAQRRGR